MEYEYIRHPFAPVFDERSRVLILGTLPSVKSREQAFYYGHRQNRFWKVLCFVLEEPEPVTTEEKRAMLLRHGVALWDVIESCEICGSSDSSIRSAVPADLSGILSAAPIRAVFVNGKTAAALYRKYQQPTTGIPAVTLPSTSPANAAWSLLALRTAWQEALAPALEREETGL